MDTWPESGSIKSLSLHNSHQEFYSRRQDNARLLFYSTNFSYGTNLNLFSFTADVLLWMNFSLPLIPLQLSSDKPCSLGFITVGNSDGNFPLYRGIWYYAECLVRESSVSDAIVDVALSQHIYLYRQTTFLVMAVRLA